MQITTNETMADSVSARWVKTVQVIAAEPSPLVLRGMLHHQSARAAAKKIQHALRRAEKGVAEKVSAIALLREELETLETDVQENLNISRKLKAQLMAVRGESHVTH